jgi:hypothetical protein
MIIIEFIVLVLASLGVINIFIYSPIAEGLRNLVLKTFTLFGNEKMGQYLIACPTCVGFWIGVIMTAIYTSGGIIYTIPFMISFLGYLARLYWFPEE